MGAVGDLGNCCICFLFFWGLLTFQIVNEQFLFPTDVLCWSWLKNPWMLNPYALLVFFPGSFISIRGTGGCCGSTDFFSAQREMREEKEPESV